MARIAGIKIIKDSKGNPKQLVIDIKKHAQYVEDFLDLLEVEARKDEETVPSEEVFERLDKKHGIKTNKK